MMKKYFAIGGVILLILVIIAFYPIFSYFTRPYPPIMDVTGMAVDQIALLSESADIVRGEVTILIKNHNRMQSIGFTYFSGQIFYHEFYPPFASVNFTENLEIVALGNATATLLMTGFHAKPPSPLVSEDLEHDKLNGTTSFELHMHIRLVYECKIWWNLYRGIFAQCNYLPIYFASATGNLEEGHYDCKIYDPLYY